MAGAVLPNIEPLIAAGINPKTGLPYKLGGAKCMLKEDIKKFLRLIDEQDAVNRFVWENLPANITSQELERMIYYKGQLCFFYDKDLEEYYFMPYALDGTIDFYGRYNRIHPVPMTSGTDDKGSKAQAQYLAEKKLKCIYNENQIKEEEKDGSCVLLHDYTKQLAQTILPRVTVNEPLLDTMAECIPFMRTALISGSGIKGVRVNDADQADSVNDASRGLLDAALTGKPWVALIGNVEFQELTDGAVLKAEEYMQAMQSLDNLRLSGYGIQNGGLFSKKAHELQTEADMNSGPVGLVFQDGLEIRQHFCDLANKLFGTNISVRQAEEALEPQGEMEEEGEEEEVKVEEEQVNE